MANDRENENIDFDEEAILREVIEEVLNQTDEENAQDDDNSEDDSGAEGMQDTEEEQEEDAEEEEESQAEEEEEKKEKAKNKEEKKKLLKERREKAIEFLKSLPKKILVAIVAATSLVGSAVKSLLFGSSSYTLPPDPNPLDKLTKEAEEKEKKEKEEEQRGNSRDRGDTSRERSGGNENQEKEEDQEMDEGQERSSDAREDEDLPFEEPEQIEENTQGQEQEEETGNPEDQSEKEGSADRDEKEEEEKSEKEEGFSVDDVEESVNQTMKEDEERKAQEQAAKEEEKGQKKSGVIFAKDAIDIESHCMKNKETAEALQDVSKIFRGVKFYCDRDENGKDYISLMKGNAISRQIDAEKLLNGDASELAVACKDVGFAKLTGADYTNDTHDSKYVMMALGMCARLRGDISNTGEEENNGKDSHKGKLLAKCDLGKDYDISIHRHSFNGAKYEYSVSGEDGKGDNKKQYISHNTDLYQALCKAEQRHEGFLDEFSKKNPSWDKSWKDLTSEKVPDNDKSSNIPVGEKHMFKHYMGECSYRILNMADTAVNNSNCADYQINFNPDSFKLKSEELYKYMYSLEKGNIDGSDTYMHAVALNSKLLHEYMVDTILNYTDLDAKLILNTNDLSVGERRELKEWTQDKSKKEKHEDITGYLKSGEPIGNKMVEQLIDRLHISKAYQNFCQYDSPKKLITHYASMEIMSLAKEALKCDSNKGELRKALQDIVNAGLENCAKAVSEYFSQKIDNPVMEELMKRSYILQKSMEGIIDSHKNHWEEPKNFSPEQKDAKWYFQDNQARVSTFQSMQNIYDTMKFITFETYDKMIKDGEGTGDIVNVASDIKDIMDKLGMSEISSCDSYVKILCDATAEVDKTSDFVENVHEVFNQLYKNNGFESLVNSQLYDRCTTENFIQLICDVPQIANDLMNSVNKEAEGKDRIDMEKAIELVCDEISLSDNPWDAFDDLKGDCSSLADSIINPEGMDNQEQKEQTEPEAEEPDLG